MIMLWFILKIQINATACQKDKEKNKKTLCLNIHHQVPLSNIVFIEVTVFELADPYTW